VSVDISSSVPNVIFSTKATRNASMYYNYIYNPTYNYWGHAAGGAVV